MRIINKIFSRDVPYVSLFLFFIFTSHLSAEKFKAVTTFTVIADMAQNVAGNIAIVESITKAGAEIHGYEPTPRDIVRAQDADLIFWNGLNLELWFDQFFSNLSDVPSAILTEGILPIDIRDGEYAGRPNPHAWMSLDSALIYVDNIRKAFVEIINLSLKLGGTIAGEHGIGTLKKDFIKYELDKIQLKKMKEIKKLFDPNLILNPGKKF